MTGKVVIRMQSGSTSGRWRFGKGRLAQIIPMLQFRSTILRCFITSNAAMRTQNSCTNVRWRFQQKAFSPNHPNVAVALNNLSAHYESQRRYADAFAYTQQTFANRSSHKYPSFPVIMERNARNW